LADAALLVLMGSRSDLGLVGTHTLFVDVTNVVAIQDEGEPLTPSTTSWPSLDQDDGIASVSATPADSAEPMHPHPDSPTAPESFISTTGNSKVKTEATSKTPSSTQKSRATMKRNFQDVFAEGSVKDSQLVERLGTQKHERVLGEQELKRQKLAQKVTEQQHQRERECEQLQREQHQREREREQHEFRMLQMQVMMSQNAQGAMQSRNQPSLEGLGFMAELNDAVLPSNSSYSI
jgi:hypothetical protein